MKMKQLNLFENEVVVSKDIQDFVNNIELILKRKSEMQTIK